MVAQSETDISLTMSDGAQIAVNIYWDDADSNRPVVGFWPGGGGDRTDPASRAQAVAARGMLGFSCDLRGGGLNGVANGEALGRTIGGARDILDMFELIEAVIARHADKVDSTKIGVAGTSLGGINSWYAVACSGQFPFGDFIGLRTQRFPKILAASPASWGPSSYDHFTNGGTGIAANSTGILGSQSPLVFKDAYLTEIRAKINDSDETFNEWIGGNDNNFGRGMVYDMQERVEANDHTKVLAFSDWDDTWLSANTYISTIDRLVGRDPTKYETNHALVIGSVGFHGATNVTAEESAMWTKRYAFFESALLGDDTNIAANFAGSPATWEDVSEVEFSLTPNTDADYQVTNGVYADVNSRAVGRCNNISYLKHLATDSAINTDATRWYLATSNALASSAGAAGSATISNDSGSTRAAMTTAIAAGTDSATWAAANFTRDTESFTVSYAAGVHRIVAGIPKVKLWVTALKDDVQIAVDLVYIYNAGANTQHMSSGVAVVNASRTPQEVDIELDACAFRIEGGTGRLLGLRISNLALKDPPYSGSKADGVLRTLPNFNDTDFTVHFGGTQASYIDVPTFPDATTVLDA